MYTPTRTPTTVLAQVAHLDVVRRLQLDVNSKVHSLCLKVRQTRRVAEEDKARKKAVGAASAAIFDDLRNEVEVNLPEPTSPWSYEAGELTFEPDWSSFLRLIALSHSTRCGLQHWTAREGH
ncbi:MAG: hypothetical protein R2697_00545 [Ilumatobacteraceae bacterium]